MIWVFKILFCQPYRNVLIEALRIHCNDPDNRLGVENRWNLIKLIIFKKAIKPTAYHFLITLLHFTIICTFKIIYTYYIYMVDYSIMVYYCHLFPTACSDSTLGIWNWPSWESIYTVEISQSYQFGLDWLFCWLFPYSNDGETVSNANFIWMCCVSISLWIAKNFRKCFSNIWKRLSDSAFVHIIK